MPDWRADSRRDLLRETLSSQRGGQFTGSVGIAISSNEDEGWNNIYVRADKALYEAKPTGKNRVERAPVPCLYPDLRPSPR